MGYTRRPHLPEGSPVRETTLHIDGMTCNHCVGGVQKALARLEGVNVKGVSVGSATVEYDEALVSRAQIDAAIGAAGYSVRGEHGAGAPPA